MFKRRDIPPVLLLLLLIILVMLTLSQILVVHSGHYGRSVHNMRKLQLELREMDVNLHALMMQNVPSIELNRRMLQNEIYAHRFVEILSQASHIDPQNDGIDLPSNRLVYSPRRASNVSPGAGGDPRGTPVPDSHYISDSFTDNDEVSVVSRYSESKHPLSGHHGRSLAGSETQHVIRTATGENQRRNQSVNEQSHGNTQYKPSVNRLQNGVNTSPGSSRTSQIDPPRQNSTAPRQLRSRPELSAQLKSKINYCPSIPPLLKGRIDVRLENSSLTWTDVARENPHVRSGGTWSPPDCVARHRVAIIIPYRDREQHLVTLMYYLHPILQKQQLDYRLYVVEQQGLDSFNKARIMNVAFIEALKQHNFQCFVFHDVDLVPEYDTNMYSCPLQPRHMSVGIDEMGYRLAYQELVGGVLNMRTEHFQRVNGYSNLYWGWGAEDDDMAYRIMHVGLKITRPPDMTARYKMAKHTKRKPADWRKRAKLLFTGTRRFQFDGLNSLKYTIIHNVDKPLYTHLLVDIGRPPRGF